MSTFNFLFFPHHNTGGHYCCWSLYYLFNQQQYPTNDKKICNICEPSIDKIESEKNFHQHPALMIRGYNEVLNVLNDTWYQQFNMVNFYVEPLHFYNVIKDQYNLEYNSLSKNQLNEVFNYIVADAQKMLHEIQKLNHNLYVFEFVESDLYTRVYNDRYPSSSLKNEFLGDMNSRWLDWEQTWFQNTNQHFNDTIWDQREKFALIAEREPYNNWLNKINRSLPHLYYTNDDVWNAMPTCILEMCHFAGFDPDPVKLNTWSLTYNKWRLKHDPWLSRHIDRIVDAIINNHYLSLERFNLDFYKEVLIQHVLIKKYNMNLKNWQLEKFPSNTQDLHKLLEPNIHSL